MPKDNVIRFWWLWIQDFFCNILYSLLLFACSYQTRIFVQGGV